MNSTIRRPRDLTAATSSAAAQVAAPPAASPAPWVRWVWAAIPLAGVIMGVLAQFIRQIPGALMDLGASVAPWVMVGFLLAVWASRGARTTRKAVLIATGAIAAYLVMWLVSYHLVFVVREHVRLAAGWREAAPWLLVTIPASPFLGTIAALSHRDGFLGDLCLVAPIAWSLPEIVKSLRGGLLVDAAWAAPLADRLTAGASIAVPVTILAALLIHMAARERRLRATSLLAAAVTLGALGVAILPIFRGLITLRRFLEGGGLIFTRPGP